MPSDNGKVKQLVRAGVAADGSTSAPTGRSTNELKAKVRQMVERSIMQMSEVAKKEFLSVTDLELLQKLHKLLCELEAPETEDPSKMTDEELAKRVK